MVSAGICFHDARINGKAFALNQASAHAGSHDRPHLTQDIALAKAAVSVDRERRMIWDGVLKAEPTKPSISQMKLDFLTQLPLGAKPVAIAYDQHSDQKLGINRRPTNLAVERR